MRYITLQTTEALTEEWCCQKYMVQSMKKKAAPRTEPPLLHLARISFEAPLASLICPQIRLRLRFESGKFSHG